MPKHDDLQRFIPFRKAETVELLCADGRLNEEDRQKFRNFCKILESLYHFEFHDKVEELKNNYFPFNPDRDTRSIRDYSPEELKACEHRLLEKFKEILNDANYEEMSQADLDHALDEESVFFKISLFVDFDEYDSCLLCHRGDVVHTATIKKGFKTVEVEVPTFERVAMLIKFKNAEYFAKKKVTPIFEPGSMVIKLFKNIPKADLEMLFPNTQVKMKLKDKLMLGIPALAGGVGTLMKASAGLIAFFAVLWALCAGLFGGKPADLSDPKLIGQLVGGLSALAILAGFIFKQWTKYKNRKIQFMKMLGDSLYFKNLDNNAGVFHHIIDAAEEEECKEAILGYYFLLLHPEGLTEEQLDSKIEEWFASKHDTKIDFEVDDALRKLKELELCTIEGEGDNAIYRALDIDAGCTRLDEIWDNYFQYNV
jgi:hypothetical protein